MKKGLLKTAALLVSFAMLLTLAVPMAAMADDTGVLSLTERNVPYVTEVSDETLTAAIISEPTSLNPEMCGAYGGVICNALYDSLIFFNSNTGEYEPQLAESWEIAEDGLSITFKLREDVTFTDGSPLTAEDVLYTFQQGIANPESNSDYSRYDVDAFEIIDDHTIKIVAVDGQQATILSALEFTTFDIIGKNATEALGGYEALVMSPTTGSGPYKFVEWRPGEYVRMERNDNYWGEAPYYKEIVVRFITDSATLVMAMQSGEVDVITGVNAAQADSLVFESNVKVSYQTSVNAVTLCMNVLDDTLSNLNLRKAIAHAINKDAIVAIFCEGYGTPLETVVSPANPLCSELDPEYYYEYDPEKAKEYLKEAGYEDGVTVELLYYAAHQTIAEVLQNNLGAVGINLELKASEDWSNIAETGEFQILLCQFFGRTNTQVFGLMDNRPIYKNRHHCAFGGDEYNERLDQLYAAQDPSTVVDVAKSLMEDFQENIPAVGICSTQYLYASKANLTNFYTVSGRDQLRLERIRPAQ